MYHLLLHVRHRLIQIYIVYMVMVHLMVRMGSVSILSIRWSIFIEIMINFDMVGD